MACQTSASTSKTCKNLPPNNIVPINKTSRKVLANKNLNCTVENKAEQQTAFVVTPEELQTLQNFKFITPMNIDNFVYKSEINQSINVNYDNEIVNENSAQESEEIVEYLESPTVDRHENETLDNENDECHQCKNYLKLIIRNQNKILALLRDQGSTSCGEKNYLPELPCNTLPALIRFEKLLNEKEACRRQLENGIESLGGNNLQKSVNNAMYYIMTDEVARKCTWSGSTENSYKIKRTRMARIICKVLVAKKQGTVVEIDGRIALWLRRVGDRIKAENKAKENAARKLERENALEED